MINQNEWRSELKFDVTNYNQFRVLNLIKTHQLVFKEQYKKRHVNNIYFDKSNYEAFNYNIMGVSERLKARIRWYGDTFSLIKNPVFELKIKNRELGRKEYFKINDFNISIISKKNEIYNDILTNNIFNSKIKKIILKTKPVLLNSYDRRYFISSCKNFRITYDTNLNFYNFSHTKFLKTSVNNKILEIKFKNINFNKCINLTQHFPFRINKSSKYVTGINVLSSTPTIY